ncbi:YkuS family protein [Shouchella shacheensis]|uniref:YkuS family protein n=1 Tax=Shouchella shacheensis TaxID=1649580 RepID=UPI00073FD2E9|nr:YkuS family protein [Shouchella shacheensis]
MAKIGVEGSLTDVRDELQAKGYDVVDMRSEDDAKGCDCCVISGQDQNMLGMQGTSIQGSVINASGRTAEEVCQQVDHTMQNMQ